MGAHMQSGDAKTQVARVLHLLASILTLVAGLIHVFQRRPKISWPDHFIDDVNMVKWRAVMFSLAPSVFIDNWTAVVLGLWGVLSHMKNAGSILGAPTIDFLNGGIFLLIMALWGTIAYAGGIGIIFSCFSFLGSLTCLILAFVDNKQASLEFA